LPGVAGTTVPNNQIRPYFPGPQLQYRPRPPLNSKKAHLVRSVSQKVKKKKERRKREGKTRQPRERGGRRGPRKNGEKRSKARTRGVHPPTSPTSLRLPRAPHLAPPMDEKYVIFINCTFINFRGRNGGQEHEGGEKGSFVRSVGLERGPPLLRDAEVYTYTCSSFYIYYIYTIYIYIYIYIYISYAYICINVCITEGYHRGAIARARSPCTGAPTKTHARTHAHNQAQVCVSYDLTRYWQRCICICICREMHSRPDDALQSNCARGFRPTEAMERTGFP